LKSQNSWRARIQTRSETDVETMERDCLSYSTGRETKTIFRLIKTGPSLKKLKQKISTTDIYHNFKSFKLTAVRAAKVITEFSTKSFIITGKENMFPQEYKFLLTKNNKYCHC
jgi:hypothetical protein